MCRVVTAPASSRVFPSPNRPLAASEPKNEWPFTQPVDQRVTQPTAKRSRVGQPRRAKNEPPFTRLASAPKTPNREVEEREKTMQPILETLVPWRGDTYLGALQAPI